MDRLSGAHDETLEQHLRPSDVQNFTFDVVDQGCDDNCRPCAQSGGPPRYSCRLEQVPLEPRP